MELFTDMKRNFYQIRAFDTLLGKERFVLSYEEQRWRMKEEEGDSYELDPKAKLGNILPPLALFNYLAFLRGEIPILNDTERLVRNKKDIYIRGDYRQEVIYQYDTESKRELAAEINIFYQQKKIYKMEYEKYVFLKTADGKLAERYFPKILNIVDFSQGRKIVWWFSSINEWKE